ncbi:FecR family protein [Cyclobacterium lianum]|uniref:FecR family protein n=1 Tax=Cyclobacterium lianum TaxID=388280 RepID=A0A1M7LF43_9BACT|nr:FecR domain-containing protein [Cyclobacterium lianum]SHM76586.1 FecR family protein [Cyclobacterium lianum]
MSKTEYTVEDFMLDPEFKKWVLAPDEESSAFWEGFLEKHPEKYENMKLARRALINLSRNVGEISDSRIEGIWTEINKFINEPEKEQAEGKTISISSESTLRSFADRQQHIAYRSGHQFYRVAGILFLVFSLGILFNLLREHPEEEAVEIPLVYEEYSVPPGVKSTLRLQDGSRVILNSGSSLRYVKNFEADKRELFLIGEAYFEVAKDSLRPFVVKTGPVSTKALGTSFNITAYKNEPLEVSLLTGKVNVGLKFEKPQEVILMPGEGLNVVIDRQVHNKHRIKEEKVLAWTRKTILFEQTPVEEAIRVLENWYGVQIEVLNRPERGVLLSGKFVDQTLEGVLEGLSYSARFRFKLDEDRVTVKFDKST